MIYWVLFLLTPLLFLSVPVPTPLPYCPARRFPAWSGLSPGGRGSAGGPAELPGGEGSGQAAAPPACGGSRRAGFFRTLATAPQIFAWLWSPPRQMCGEGGCSQGARFPASAGLGKPASGRALGPVPALPARSPRCALGSVRRWPLLPYRLPGPGEGVRMGALPPRCQLSGAAAAAGMAGGAALGKMSSGENLAQTGFPFVGPRNSPLTCRREPRGVRRMSASEGRR